jgi:hypothetical protein
MVAAEANSSVPSFGYYERGQNQILQAAPITIGLGVVIADRVTRHDPATGGTAEPAGSGRIRRK